MDTPPSKRIPQITLQAEKLDRFLDALKARASESILYPCIAGALAIINEDNSGITANDVFKAVFVLTNGKMLPKVAAHIEDITMRMFQEALAPDSPKVAAKPTDPIQK